MKIRKIIVSLCIFALLFVPTYNAMTIAETEDKIAQMQADMQEEIDKAENARYTYDEVTRELQQMAIDQEELEAQIVETEAAIAQTEADIATIEAELPVLIAQAEEVLSMLQVTKNQNYVLDQFFSTDDNAKTAIRKTNALSSLTEEAVDIVNLVIEKQKELEEKQATLESQQNDLAYQVAFLDEQIAYANELQKQQQQIIAESETQIDEGASDIVAQQDLIALMEAAGCGPDDVYMVDCGVPPPPAETESGPVTSTGFARPMQNGYVTAEYGASEIDYYCGFHNGIDLASDNPSEPIYSVATGQVISVMGPDESGGYGNYVIVQHNIDGTIYYSKYAHLSSVYVTEGQNVTTSTQIGNMGNTGMSYGSHLHLSIQQGGGAPDNCNTIDPRSVINFPPLNVYWNTRS